jgi:predicted  nucleic acid-binding Zn-ribbon protein
MGGRELNRLDLYLQWGVDTPAYVNTKTEQELVTKFEALFCMAQAAQNRNVLANPENIAKWRKAYYGTLNALKADGTESERRARQVRKMVYEFVESKVDNSIPQPKMMPRYKTDLPLVEVTEDFLKYNTDVIFTKYLNDRSERATYVDGTSWYKVWWDSIRGMPKVDVRLADQVIPQPGITDWRKLEYIFELEQMSLARIYDLYGRIITPVSSDQSYRAGTNNEQVDMSTITTVTCYYLNEDRVVGKFMWAKNSLQVICNEHDWQIRKVRKCTKCGHIQPEGSPCAVCGGKTFRYKPADKEFLEEDLYYLYNPYDVGETNDPMRENEVKSKIFLTKGTEIPFYTLHQLPFVPRPAVSSIESIYGVSEAFTLLEIQDCTNKMLTKMVDKAMKSGAVITKPHSVKLNDVDESFKIVDVKTAEQASMVQGKQIISDINQDIAAASLLYESGRASSGITASFQGKEDPTAISGKAKEYAAAQSAGRIESLRVMKAAAFAGVYELVLKYCLAFCDQPVKFAKVLPDGQAKQMIWNKYMFLDINRYGQIYYRDDFEFSTDPAATLSTNRVAMWQETRDSFINGCMGNPADERTLELYWTMMEQHQYPLAKTVLAGIKDNSQHLPPEIEQLLIANPELLKNAMALAQQQGTMQSPLSTGQGGARANSGPDGNGATHSVNVERTNERNRAQNRQVATTAEQQGGQVQ